MNPTFDLDRAAGELRDSSGRRFDAQTRIWSSVLPVPMSGGERVDVLAALTWLQRESQHPLRVPIGVIGPREATSAQLRVALQVGELLADCGLVVICGGRHGVMQAVFGVEHPPQPLICTSLLISAEIGVKSWLGMQIGKICRQSLLT